MKLDLEKYPTQSLLASYEFIFSQYIGGMASPPEELEKVCTPYIFGEVCSDVRNLYLARKDASVEKLVAAEKRIIERLAELMNMDEKQLRKIYEEMLIKVLDDGRKIREEKLDENVN